MTLSWIGVLREIMIGRRKMINPIKPINPAQKSRKTRHYNPARRFYFYFTRAVTTLLIYRGLQINFNLWRK